MFKFGNIRGSAHTQGVQVGPYYVSLFRISLPARGVVECYRLRDWRLLWSVLEDGTNFFSPQAILGWAPP